MKNLTLTLLGLWTTMLAVATDRFVAEGGAGGAFPTVTDAVTAAVTGDRIIIYPKAGGSTYNENLTITNKSLQFLSATEGEYWKLNGSITFNPTTAGQSMTVIGAHITAGNITTGISSPVGTRTKVNIMGCKFTNGFIDFNGNYFDLNISADSLMNGYVYMRYGKVMGCFIDAGALCAHGVYVTTDAGVSNDVVHIVGNKIDATTNACTNYGIHWTSSSQFYNISNNYIKQNGASQNGIYVSNTKTSAVLKNKLMNNSVQLINTNNLGIYVASFGSYSQVFNNVITNVGSGGYGLGSSAASIFFEASYNYVSASVITNAFYNFVDDGTNQYNSSNTMSAATGEITAGPAINGGSPDLQFNDIDLTRNDAGCFGGSWTRENFLNITNTDTQVIFFDAPGRILTGQTINITGEGFDR